MDPRSALSGGLVLALTLVGAALAMPVSKAASAPVERGHMVAARDCARCHAVEAAGPSARPTAPPFRDIRHRYNELSLQREFAAIREVGHYEMPPTPISQGDARDLAAYIDSLH
jgi:cytochrome c553